MYRIGEFSDMTGLSKDTLRYYAKIDLLKPIYTDPNNQYTYYDNGSYLMARILVYCRKFHFSIQEMLAVVNERSLDELEEILKEKKLALQNEILKIDEVIKQIDDFLTINEEE